MPKRLRGTKGRTPSPEPRPAHQLNPIRRRSRLALPAPRPNGRANVAATVHSRLSRRAGDCSESYSPARVPIVPCIPEQTLDHLRPRCPNRTPGECGSQCCYTRIRRSVRLQPQTRRVSTGRVTSCGWPGARTIPAPATPKPLLDKCRGTSRGSDPLERSQVKAATRPSPRTLRIRRARAGNPSDPRSRRGRAAAVRRAAAG